ncbi:MAG: SCO family protein [Planctomycetaceae bacterium]|nr:SCO family protein [Planctomycetaceae bacterium]
MRQFAHPVLLCLALSCAAAPAAAENVQFVPPEVRDIQIIEHLGGQLPLDAAFTDDNGKPVRLADYFNHDRPVMLSVVYYECPMLCGLATQALLNTLNQLPGRPGEDFEVVTVSFDPTETADLAFGKKKSVIAEYQKPDAADGWHFLVGTDQNVKALTDAVGFRSRWDEKSQQFAHAAALMIITPDGRLSRYLHGVYYEPKETQDALRAAAAGLIAEPTDPAVARSLFMTCFKAIVGEQANMVTQILRGIGALSLIILALVLVPLWIRSARAGRQS